MAERRMFCKSIMRSDAYLDMPAEAQALYVQLCMEADDDGFVDSPRSVMRSCGASNDSMKLLIAKKFVLAFNKEDGFIALIKGWRMHNYIAKDRYNESRYRTLLHDMWYDKNGSYTTNPDSGVKPCIQSVDTSYTGRIQTVSKVETQDRLGKDRLDKVSLNQEERKERSADLPPEYDTGNEYINQTIRELLDRKEAAG